MQIAIASSSKIDITEFKDIPELKFHRLSLNNDPITEFFNIIKSCDPIFNVDIKHIGSDWKNKKRSGLKFWPFTEWN